MGDGLRAAILILMMLLFSRLQAAETVGVLENENLRLEVSSQNGAIARIFDRRSKTEYITDQARAKLFQFLIPKSDYPARRINSWDQKPLSIESADGVLTLKFRNLQISRQKYIFQVGVVDSPEPQLPIDVTVKFRLQDEHVLASIEVQNNSLEEITDVAFPWIDGLPRESEGQPFKVALPSLSQKTLSDAPENLIGERAKPYPGLLATSWINYQTATKGLGLEVQSEPEAQEALVSASPNTLASNSPAYWVPPDIPYIGWTFYPHIGGQGSWKSPSVVIHVHGTDWHTMAAEHREWYREQHRPQRISAFDHAAGFATYRLKKDDNTVNWTYDELPKLVEISAKAGIRDLVIDGWREREGPGNDSPFGEFADPRLGGGARLKAINAKLRQGQVNLLFAFHPTVINTASDHYKKDSLRWTVRTRREANQMQSAYTFYTFDYPYQEYIAHYWAVVDPSSAATAHLLRDAQRLKEEYGFRNLFLRGVGLQSFLSYNKETAVPPQKAFQAGYERFLGGLRAMFPNGLLLMEGFNDLVNPYGDGGYTWVQNTDAEVLAYSIPWIPFSNDVDALDYDLANASFARKILINLIVDGGDGSVDRYFQFAQHLKALQSLKEASSPYYAQAEFRDREGLGKVDADAQVVVASYENSVSKKRGIVLANLSEQSKKGTVEVDTKSTKGRLFRLGGQQTEVALPRLAVELAPYEVVVLGMDNN